MGVSARGNSKCRCTVVNKTKVLQGGAKGAVMVIQGQVASKGSRKEG